MYFSAVRVVTRCGVSWHPLHDCWLKWPRTGMGVEPLNHGRSTTAAFYSLWQQTKQYSKLIIVLIHISILGYQEAGVTKHRTAHRTEIHACVLTEQEGNVEYVQWGQTDEGAKRRPPLASTSSAVRAVSAVRCFVTPSGVLEATWQKFSTNSRPPDFPAL